MLLSDSLDKQELKFLRSSLCCWPEWSYVHAQPSVEKEARVAVIVVAKLCSGAWGGSHSLSTLVPISENRNSVSQTESETACRAVSRQSSESPRGGDR